MDIFKRINNSRSDAQLFFYRDSNKNEVDLIISNRGELTAVEIKSAGSFHDSALKGLRKWRTLLDANKPLGTTASAASYLIYSGQNADYQGFRLLGYQSIGELVAQVG
jgi:predicted AAA+ superfamily ATPase